MNKLILLCGLCTQLAVAAAPVSLHPSITGVGGSGDHFGIALHSDADWVMVGAYGDLISSREVFSGVKSGSVQVYKRIPLGLLPVQNLRPPAPTQSTLFGDEIQRAGNLLAVSAPRFSSSGEGLEGGAVFLFQLVGEQWQYERTIVPPEAGAFGRFGESILLHDGQLWVGAPVRGAGGEVLRYDLGSTSTAPTAIISGAPGARLGETMAVIDAGQLAIGAPGAGQVLIYPFTEPLLPLHTLSGPFSFGKRLAASGDMLVVAAVDDGPGTVHRWRREGGDWIAQPVLTPAQGNNGDQFGESLLIMDDHLLIGAPGTDNGAEFDVGAVYRAPLSGAAGLAARTLPALSRSALFGSMLVKDQPSGRIMVGVPLARVDHQHSGVVLFYEDGVLGTPVAEAVLQLDRGAGAQLFRFAQSLAIDADRIVSGAFLADTEAGADSGAVYGFALEGGEWVEDGRLIPTDGIVDQRLGLAVDVRGDRAIAGAYWDVINGRAEQGSAYFFRREPQGWVQDAKVFAANGNERDNFGAAVAMGSNLAAVGARGANLVFIDQGAVDLYRLVGQSWQSAGQVVALQPQAFSFFGQAVAVCGQRFVVGAPGADRDVEFTSNGRAYVYEALPGGGARLIAQLDSTTLASNLNFGFAVACHGSTVAVGAPGGGDVAFGGEVEVFECSSSGCVPDRLLRLADAAPGDQLGVAVAVHGQRILAGASGVDVDDAFDVGAAVLFERGESGGWQVLQHITAPAVVALGGFGRAVDMDARRMVIASPTAAGENPAEGALWVFEQPAGTLLLRDGFESLD